LCNVDLFGEGFDLPSLEVCIMLRPTQSLALFLQQIGRALRTNEGKEYAIIIDCAGNISRHGLPCDDREWTLLGRPKGKKKDEELQEKLRQCPECYHTHTPAPSCPECGFVYEIQGRKVEEVEGELLEIDLNAMRKQKNMEQSQARDTQSLIALGKKRNMKNPIGWAYHVNKAREKKSRAK
jgi:superfamily II DNA or RNA helicase